MANVTDIRGKQGKWKVKHKEGSYQDGRKIGEWTWWHDTGFEKRSGVFSESEPGSRIGKWKEWYEYGQIASKGKYDAGTKHGEWKYYYDNMFRSLSEMAFYDHGEPIERHRWSEAKSGTDEEDEDFISDNDDSEDTCY